MVCDIKLIIGMAGTGKTYKLVRMFKRCKCEAKLFLTYTNENAARLSETYGVKCETIHSHFKLNYVKKDYKEREATEPVVDCVFVDEIGIIPYDIIKFLMTTTDTIVGTVDFLQLLPINAKEHKLNFNLHIEGDIFIIQQTLAHISRLNLFKIKKGETLLLTENKRFKDSGEIFTFKNFISINDTNAFKYPILISKYKDVDTFKCCYGSSKKILSFVHNSGIRFLKNGEIFKWVALNDNLIKIMYADKVNYISKNEFDNAKFTPCDFKIIHTTQGFEFDEGSVYLDSLFLPEMLYTAITRFKNRDKVMFIYKDLNKAKKIFEQQVEIFNNIFNVCQGLIG